jgi:hypothetical protein
VGESKCPAQGLSMRVCGLGEGTCQPLDSTATMQNILHFDSLDQHFDKLDQTLLHSVVSNAKSFVFRLESFAFRRG